jgi:hypothetical protein
VEEEAGVVAGREEGGGRMVTDREEGGRRKELIGLIRPIVVSLIYLPVDI